jgi:hypothetical protein
VRPEGLGQYKKNPPHWDLNPRPSGLQHSALTTTLPHAPALLLFIKKMFSHTLIQNSFNEIYGKVTVDILEEN